MARKGPMSSQQAQELSLQRLYFGKDDAESDFARGGLLKQGFMRTRAYDEALAGTKNLIIGRKGSGKSAICLMLRDTLAPGQRCALVTPDEISADEIRRFHLPGIPQEQSKQLIWRYVFVVQIAKFILTAAKKRGDDRPEVRERVAAIKKFLVDNGEAEDIAFIDRFWKVIERLKAAISVEAFSVKVSVDGELKPPSEGAKAHSSLDLVETHLNSAAQLLNLGNTENQFHLLVDQVEKVWSNDRESDAMVVGLLLAAKEVQKSFDFVSCTVFLRTDIYEQLQFQDRDKLRGDEFHIDWDEDTLQDLILARVEASVGVAPKPGEFWQKMFPETVDGQPCRKFLISRTLMRPRDIIQLCNACRDTAKNSRHDKIEEPDIRKAMSIYSSWKLNDLQNEWSVNYPFLPDVFILFSNSSYMVTRQAVEKSLSQVRTDLVTRYPNIVQALSSEAFLSILYSIGLIGVVRHEKTIYSFGSNSDKQINISDKDFVLHPCFRNALQSTSAIRLTPYEAERDEDRIHLRIAGEGNVSGDVTVRGPRGLRAAGYTTRGVQRLAAMVAKSDLPDELRTEISANVSAMLKELMQMQEFGGEQLDVLGRLHRHLRKLAERLEEGGWLRREKDLFYILKETEEELARIVYRGDLGEYRR